MDKECRTHKCRKWIEKDVKDVVDVHETQIGKLEFDSVQAKSDTHHGARYAPANDVHQYVLVDKEGAIPHRVKVKVKN